MKKNTSISMITSGHPVAAIIMLSVCLTSLCLIGCAGCGGVKETQIDKVTITSPAQKALTHDSIVHIKKLVKDDAKVQISKSGAQVIQNDSVYAIIFRNDDGDSVGYYDIWNNNPFDDLPFEKQKLNKVNQPLRYYVPDILINNFIEQFPQYQVDFIEGTSSIGRIDVYTNLPYISEIDNYSNYLPITYQMNCMQGFYEEFEVPGSYAIGKIFDKYGTLYKSIKIPNFSGIDIAVTQDGKYIVYGQNSIDSDFQNCFKILDLNKKEVLLSHCAEKGKDLRGAGISKDGYSILLTSQDLSSPRMKPVELFVFNSLDGKLYYKKDNPDAQYAGLKIEGDYFKFLMESSSGSLKDENYQISKDFKVLKQLK